MSVQPTVCLLHADVHAMRQECWSATTDWFMAHQHLDEADRRDAYQAEAERLMLAEIRLGQAVDHSVPAASTRAIRRDHSICGAEPCSDCR